MAWRYLCGARGFASIVAWFSFIGISLGVATLIIVMSVMNGFRHELFDALVGVRGHLSLSKSTPFQSEEAQEVTNKLRANKCIRGAIPLLEGQAVIFSGSQARGVQIQGLSPSDLQYRPRMELQSGQDLDEGVWVGKQLAHFANLQPGGIVTLMQPMGRITPFGRVPEQVSFKVDGIFSTGMYDFDKNIIVMPLKKAQSFFHLGDVISQVEIHVNSNVDPITIVNEWSSEADYRILDWKHADAAIFNAVEVERSVMTVILALIILIASFNIISSLVMLVQQKTRDIAVMRSMGAHRWEIGRLFLITGSGIGILGTFLGLALGLSFSMHIDGIRLWLEQLTNVPLFQAEIYFLSKLPCKVVLSEVFCIAGFSIIISVCAALYPSWKSTRMEPLDALRY